MRPVPLVLALALALPLHAQHQGHGGRTGKAAPDSAHGGGHAFGIGAQAVGLLTHVTPAIRGEDRTEGYLTQPTLMGHAALAGGRVTAMAMVNLEGLTLRRGELNPGVYGEGYVDRRHPHTLLHEASLSLRGSLTGVDWSVTAGKGFAPFGTDDPMVRPFVKYPVNHHLAQILERGVVIGAVRRGPLLLEAGLFNGDEPSAPEDLLRLARFGDSWAGRLTVLPLRGLEVQGSYAAVESPELVFGGGLNHRKWSASARWEREVAGGGRSYALAEWARTDEYEDERRYYRFSSALAEAATSLRSGLRLAGRYERTTRPEEERLENPFRSPRPHAEFSLLGETRWDIASLSVGWQLQPHRMVGVLPFAEVAHAYATPKERTPFWNPETFYGSDRQWSGSLGLRFEFGTTHHRMGRYGVALP